MEQPSAMLDTLIHTLWLRQRRLRHTQTNNQAGDPSDRVDGGGSEPHVSLPGWAPLCARWRSR